MNHTSSSLARVLAAPWQQRRNAGGAWSLAGVVALCALAPVCLSTWRLLADARAADRLQRAAEASAWVGVGALLVVGWAMLVGNVLQQNQPALARLVPGHVGRLRTALLVAWAVLALAAAGGPGYASGAPLAWACAAAAASALFAAALRWPLLWFLGGVAPFAMAGFLKWRGHDGLVGALASQWQSADWLVAAIVATAGALVLTLMVRAGGTAHLAPAPHRGGILGTFPSCRPARGGQRASRLYLLWANRLLARGGTPVMTRVLLGLGPETHWTTRVFQAFCMVACSAGIFLLIAGVAGGRTIALILPWFAFSMLTGVCTPALQPVPKLAQTRREQALLVLLPGVPRGARLNRWLAWQMSLSFVVSALCGLALAGSLDAWADAIEPGVVQRSTGGLTAAIAAALLPQVAWQWRRWARLEGESVASQILPTLGPFLLGAVVFGLHVATGLGWAVLGVALTAVSLLLCAWRWWRMGGEPSAFPVGRLA